MLESGGVPQLAELRLHNGTIYRWNRPVYDIAGGVPHLRVENRVLAAGPALVDTMTVAAFSCSASSSSAACTARTARSGSLAGFMHVRFRSIVLRRCVGRWWTTGT